MLISIRLHRKGRFIEIIYHAFIIRIKIEIKREREELLSETIYMNELSKESCK